MYAASLNDELRQKIAVNLKIPEEKAQCK